MMQIYCVACETNVKPRLTDGGEIYPHRKDLKSLPFWKCDACNNHVGCHHKTDNPTRPLGVIPTPELRNARKKIHEILDPLWKEGNLSRSQVYAKVSEKVGWKYHTAKIKSMDEARKIYVIIKEIRRNQCQI